MYKMMRFSIGALFLMTLYGCGGGGGDGGSSTAPTANPILFAKASNPGSGDFFGRSIAASADGNSLAVGAWAEASNATGINGDQADNSALNAGAAYVFTRDSGGNVTRTYVKASNTDAGDQFGISVALSGDGSTLAVGANTEDTGDIDAGAVYVYDRS